MAKTLVTGGTGFIGSHLVRALVERGDDVRVTVRPKAHTSALSEVPHEEVACDVLDRRALKRALKDVDKVFHSAGLFSLRFAQDRLYRANVEGTRILLDECVKADVERVIYTSSASAVGVAPEAGRIDESAVFGGEAYAIPYVMSKHEAEREALRYAAKGLPVVIVNPAFVLGPGDVVGRATELVRRFLSRDIPAYVDGGLNVVDVRDVARGHLLADERGEVGERYILGNRNFTLDRLFADLGRISGIEPPALKLPLQGALALAAALERLPGQPAITSTEVKAASAWWTYSNAKARRELGWQPSPHEYTIESTVEWYREREGGKLARAGSRQPVHLRVAALAMKQAEGAAALVVNR